AGFNVDMYLNNQKSTNRQLYFDRKHQADGGVYFSLNGCQPSVKDLYGNPWPEDKIDRTVDPEKVLEDYYANYNKYIKTSGQLGYFATITGNHDHLRLNTGARNSADQLKVSMAWVLTQQLPILYYGDEIGLRSLADLPNVEGANHNGKERAGGRSPMQWDSSENAGFSSCAPENIYIPVCPEWTPATSWPLYKEWKAAGCKNPTSKGMITVESQDSDPESLLNWTRSLIQLRKDTPALWADSAWEPVVTKGKPYPMVYKRSDGQQTYLIALNPTGQSRNVEIEHCCSSAAGKTIDPAMATGKVKYRSGKEKDSISMEPVSVMIVRIQ
ncbi:MAG: hypothetical protein KBS67_01935, partial [Bacteroidales bacterium]|nr:hypothetical protein [Candidatus Cryptobacteroides equifaecalis]